MAEKDDDMRISAPRIGPFEINLNTVVVLVGFAAGFVAWGYTLSELKTGRTTNAENIARLEVRMTNIEATSRILDNHEQRIVTVETNAREAAANSRALQDTMGKLATDIAVVREILQRLEQGQGVQRN